LDHNVTPAAEATLSVPIVRPYIEYSNEIELTDKQRELV
jgi:hypothetical protein